MGRSHERREAQCIDRDGPDLVRADVDRQLRRDSDRQPRLAPDAGDDMSAVIEDRPAPMPEPDQIDISDLGAVRGWRRNKNVLMTVLMGLSALIILVVLSFVLFTVIKRGWSIVAGEFPKWFTKDIQQSP